MCHALTAHHAWPRRIEYWRVAPIYDSYARTRSWHNQARTCCTALQGKVSRLVGSWWRHQMETFSALRAICAGYSLVSREFPAQRPVTRSFYVFFDLRLNKRLKKTVARLVIWDAIAHSLNRFSGADERKHQSSVSLAFVRAQKEPVARKMLLLDGVIMSIRLLRKCEKVYCFFLSSLPFMSYSKWMDTNSFRSGWNRIHVQREFGIDFIIVIVKYTYLAIQNIVALIRHSSPVNSPHKGQWRGALIFPFDLRLKKQLSKQWWGWWFETQSRSLWRHCNDLSHFHCHLLV